MTTRASDFDLMRYTHPIVAILGLSAFHFVVALAAFFVGFSRAMDRFDNGGAPTLIDTAAESVVNVLWFPGMYVARVFQIHDNAAEWLLVFANSAFWGVVLYCVYLAIRRAVKRIA